MMEMIGQKKIKTFLNKATIDTLPRTILLVGPTGCGKHLLCKGIAEKFALEMQDITENLSLENIQEIYLRTILTLYVIDCTKITTREENVILKFLEEPPKSAFIVLLAENTNYMLSTVVNRCYQIVFERYSREELSKFLVENADEKTIISIADTPGQVKYLSTQPLQEMDTLAEKVFLSIGNANFSNMLTITNRIAFEGEKDKFDYKVFVKMLKHAIVSLITKDGSKTIYYSAYKLTTDLVKAINTPNMNAKMLFDNYLCCLQKTMRGN